MLFGGSGNTDTWTWNGSNWTLQAHGSNDPTSSGGAMAYDTATQNVVYQMASNAFPTYGWGAVCCNQPPTQGAWGYQGYVGQPNSTGSAMAYDPNSQTNIMFGGGSPGLFGSTINNATWSYNGFQWTQQSPTTSPSARYGAKIVDDEATGSIVLFGGTDANGNVLNDTWQWGDPINWGVDSVAFIETNLNTVLSSYGQPYFWGRYLSINGASPMEQTEPGLAHQNGIKLLLLDAGFSSATGKQNGINEANRIIGIAQNTYHVPRNKAIFADIDYGMSVDALWLEGWFETFQSNGMYRPGFYVDPIESPGFSSQYCSAISVDTGLQWYASLWVDQTPQDTQPGRTKQSNAPVWNPGSPPCRAQVETWQYGTPPSGSPPLPNISVDTDEMQSTLNTSLW